MAHLQYMPGDPRLVDQLVYELKSKGIFDQFRKECISDVDTRPAYQNLRQRVETSVSTFLSRQCWKPDLNKNQLREKLRKHILDGNYLEQGVERIVDQVVNPKVASVFIPQVEDLVYNYLGIPRKKAPEPESSEKKPEDLLPTDLEAVSPGSVKSNDDKNEVMETDQPEKVEACQDPKQEPEEEKPAVVDTEKTEIQDVEMSEVTVKSNELESLYKSSIPLPTGEINLENIPAPVNSPPKATDVKLENIALPFEPNLSTDIPLPDEAINPNKDQYFKPILHSDDSSSSSDSSLRRNMSPLTPIRNFNNENSCDAQQGFENDSDSKSDDKAAPSTFRFTIENKDTKENNSNSNTDVKIDTEKKKTEQTDLSYQFTNQVNINTYGTPMYDDSSNSNNLHIDYESDMNSKTNIEIKTDVENSRDSKKDKKIDDKKNSQSHKSSHRSRDSSRHPSSKDKRSDSKHSTSRESSRHDKKPSKDDKSKSSKERDRSKDRSEKKDSKEKDNKDNSTKHHDSSKSSHKGSKDKDSKSHRSSTSSHRHSSSKSSDERKSSSSSKDKEKVSESSRDKSKDKPKDSKSSSSKSDKDKKSSSKKSDDKDKKKEKKDIDDHYSSSGRGNHSRRSTDRDSNDGSSSSKGSQNHNGSKSSETKKDSKSSSSKSDNTSTSGESPSPSDKEHITKDDSKISQFKPIVRVDNHLETPIATPPRLPFVPDVTLKKPKFAANFQEAKKLMKMRKFLDDEQKRMNQEAALLLEFQANVRPSLSQVYSSIPGPELEFACVSTTPTESVPYEITNIQTNMNMEEANTDMEVETPVANTFETFEAPSAMENVELKEENTENNQLIENDVTKNSNQELPQEADNKNENTYDENKPFSELMDEITEYSKASETKAKTDMLESKTNLENVQDNETQQIETAEIVETETVEQEETEKIIETSVSTHNKYFEVTIITEELSESEETIFETKDESMDGEIESQNDVTEIENNVSKDGATPQIITDPSLIETKTKNVESNEMLTEKQTPKEIPKMVNELQYFAEHEKYNAELERHEFSNFLSRFIETVNTKRKIYLVNCDTYAESVMKEEASSIGEFEVINYYKNGHLKLQKTANIVKDVPLSTEVILPAESNKYKATSPLFSPVKSECSFELCSDYDSKLDDINKKSRQEVMEIILGSIVDSSPNKMPTIDYFTESTIGNETDNVEQNDMESTINSTEIEIDSDSLKRRIDEVESSVNNNRSVLTPKKMRKLSDSDQISSTTEESEESSNNNRVLSGKSKYLGRARRVGLPRPKRNNLSNSPSSDKSVENYIQNTPVTPNGKMKSRTKVQRYDTSDLYKPKLHYLSRRHNVS